jgi:hypothetical protein
MLILIGIMLAVCAFVVTVIASAGRRSGLLELGAVSTQWLAEHREYLMSETLASSWRKPSAGEFVAVQDQGEAQWVIRLARDAGA